MSGTTFFNSEKYDFMCILSECYFYIAGYVFIAAHKTIVYNYITTCVSVNLLI